MHFNSFKNFDHIIVPDCTDELAIKHLYAKYYLTEQYTTDTISAKITSLTTILYNRKCNLPCPNVLDKHMLEKLQSYTNPVFIGFEDNGNAVNEQLKNLGSVFFLDKYTQNKTPIFTSHSTYYTYLQSLPTNTKMNIIIASDSYSNQAFTSIQTLFQTPLGALLYHSAQYMFYSNKHFLSYLHNSLEELKQEEYWKEIKYYSTELTPDAFFCSHVQLLQKYIQNAETLIKDFKLFYQQTGYLQNYLIALSTFLKQQLYIQTDTKPIFIQPLQTLRFINNLFSIEQQEIIILDNVILSSPKQTSTLTQESSLQTKRQTKEATQLACEYVYSPKRFLEKAKKAQTLADFHIKETSDYTTFDPKQLNYSKLLKELSLTTSSATESLTQSLDTIQKAIIFNKFHHLQNQIALFLSEEEIKEHNLQRIHSSCKIGTIILNTTFQGWAKQTTEYTLIMIANTIPTLQELALNAYIYSKQHNDQEISIVCFSPNGFKKLTFQQIMKQIDKLFLNLHLH